MTRWDLLPESGIVWRVAEDRELPHADHIEMSGRKVSLIVRYRVDGKRRLELVRHLVWPTLRIDPKDVRGYLERFFGLHKDPFDPYVTADGAKVDLRKVDEVTIDGRLIFRGCSGDLTIERALFPSTDRPMAIERLTVRNSGSKEVRLSWRAPSRKEQDFGVHGEYIVVASWGPSGEAVLRPGESQTLWGDFAAWIGHERLAIGLPDEEAKRIERVNELRRPLVLDTPDPVLNRAFDMAKVRAGESLFDTALGPMHSPGGGRYYAGVWANDQAEYSGPFFGLLGDPTAKEAALNAYRIFASHMNPGFLRLPCSVEVEGDVLINGQDRGDAAMVAWGASLFALSQGDRAVAEELWPLVEWCLEYTRRRRTPDGVIGSESDELEGRFSTGAANLCTSTLAYGGLLFGARLAEALGKPRADELTREAADLRGAIDEYFGADVEGFSTYRYHEGNDILRAWICLPLVMGIDERKRGTLAALFSDRLWTSDGLATQAGAPDFWDRSTLYALQGAFYAGEADLALAKAREYAGRRLLGDHVPYPVEAYPEGGQAHLSAESALFCRVFTDGLLGIRPISLSSFEIRPCLPADWSRVELRNVHAYGGVFDLLVERTSEGWQATVSGRDGKECRVAGLTGESAPAQL
jgi:hypothetical protein